MAEECSNNVRIYNNCPVLTRLFVRNIGYGVSIPCIGRSTSSCVAYGPGKSLLRSKTLMPRSGDMLEGFLTEL